jgi:hypothetical protein
MFNIFKKKKKDDDKGGEDTQKMGMMQRLAMKKIASMSPAERNKLMQDMMKPENKGKIMAAMEMMKKTGQISEAQIEDAKKKLGL